MRYGGWPGWWRVRGNGGAGSGPRRCAVALEAAGQAAPPPTARPPRPRPPTARHAWPSAAARLRCPPATGPAEAMTHAGRRITLCACRRRRPIPPVPASGGGGERPVTVAVHLVPALAQGGITLGGREDPGLRGDPALLLDPVGARPAPGLARLERVLHRAGGGEHLGQHHGVLHGHGAAFAHVRCCRMGGVADEDHAAVVPAVELHPFDVSEVELLIVLEGSQV